MSAIGWSVVVSVVGVVLSALVSAFVAGTGWGRVDTQVKQLQLDVANRASKDDVNGLARQVSEIRGMFRLTLAEDQANPR